LASGVGSAFATRRVRGTHGAPSDGVRSARAPRAGDAAIRRAGARKLSRRAKAIRRWFATWLRLLRHHAAPRSAGALGAGLRARRQHREVESLRPDFE